MARISRNDVAEQDVYGGITDSLDKFGKKLEEVNTVYNKQIELAAKVAKAFDPNKPSGINARINAEKEMRKVVKQATETDKQAIKIAQEQIKYEEKLRQVKAGERDEIIKLQQQINKETAEKRKNIRATLDSSDAYKKLTHDTNKAQAEFKRLAAQHGVNSKQARSAKREFDLLDNKLRAVNDAARDGRRDVGRYQLAMQGMRGTLVKVASAFGLVGGGLAIFRKFGSVIVDFNQAQTDLAAISGKTAEELEPLTAQAKELGATTQFTATEITNLQIELAKLGFTSNEILNATGGIADFAAATGVEIPRAAALGGAAVRAFGLEASDIDRVVSVLGVSTTKTALNFGFLETALSTVAPVANAFGFSIEDTTALLGQLANSGFDASSAATATRNILLNLADANGKLAKELGRPIKNSEDLAGALQELDAKGVDLASTLELTDKRSVAAFNTFLKGSGDLVGLKDSITDVDDELKAMAEKRLDSVQGQFALLNSAIEGYILGTDEAAGISDKLKSVLGFLAENIGLIFNVIGKATAAFVTYKTVMFSLKMADRVKEWIDYRKAIKGSADGMKGATSSAKSFGRALKGIGFTALIALAYEFATALYDVASGASRARFEVEQLNKARDKGQATATKVSESLQDAMQKEINLINESTGSQEERDRKIDEVNKKYQKRVDSEIAKIQELIKNNEALLATEEKRAAEMEKTQSFFSPDRFIELEKQRNVVLGINTELEQQNIVLQSLNDFNSGLNQTISDQTAAYKALNHERGKKTKSDKEELNYLDELKKKRQEEYQILEDALTAETDGSERIIGYQKEQLRLLDEKIEKLEEILDLNDQLVLETRKVTEVDNLEEQKLQKSVADTQTANQEKLKSDINYLEKLNQIIDSGTDLINNASENREEQYNKEAEASKSVEDQIRASAATGNAIAQESLAAQEKVSNEKITQAQEEARMQQRIEELKALWATFNSLLGQGKNAAAAGAESFGIVSAFKNLVGFYDGTEETVADALGYTHTKDGHIVRVHDNEHIIGAKDSEMLHKAGLTKTKDIAKSAIFGSQMMANNKSKGVSYSPNQMELLNEIKGLRNDIKQEPKQWFDPLFVDGVLKGMQENVKRGSIQERNNRYFRR